MKKTYITPALRIVEVQNDAVICAGSIGVDSGTSTDKQYSNRNNFFYEGEELEEEDGKW